MFADFQVEDFPLEKRVCLTFDLDHTLSLEEMQLPLLMDNLEKIKQMYDGKPWPDHAMQFNFGKDRAKWPAERPKYTINTPQDWFRLTNFAPPFNTIGYIDQFLSDNVEGVFPHYARADLQAIGARVKLAPGVPKFFQQLREQWFGKAHLSFNIISTGMRDIIDGMPIAKEFDNIFACELISRRDGIIDGVSDIVQAFSKTRYLIRLAKGGESLIRKIVPSEELTFSYKNMICFGDGMSDIDHFAYLRKKSGYIVCVYPEGNAQSYEKAVNNKELTDRISLLTPRDYRVGSPLWTATNHRIERIIAGKCNFKPATLDSYRKGYLERKEKASAEKHIADCFRCTEDAETVLVPPNKSLVAKNEKLAVV